MAEGAGHKTRRPQQIEPQTALQFRPEVLQAATQDRERLLPPQGLPAYRHPLRQIGKKLPRLHLPRRCYRVVDFMSLDPSRKINAALAAALNEHLAVKALSSRLIVLYEVGLDRRPVDVGQLGASGSGGHLDKFLLQNLD